MAMGCAVLLDVGHGECVEAGLRCSTVSLVLDMTVGGEDEVGVEGGEGEGSAMWRWRGRVGAGGTND